ncbi:MAG: hypothetical protein ABI743_12405 [bacterium]
MATHPLIVETAPAPWWARAMVVLGVVAILAPFAWAAWALR